MKPRHKFNSIYFETTRRCNLRCPFCMTGSQRPAVVERSKRAELTHQEIVDHLFVPAKELSVQTFGFSGGEFLVRSDALDIVRSAADLDYQVNVVSNGVLLDDATLRELKAAARGKLVIAFGINALDDEVNEKTRQVEVAQTEERLAQCAAMKIRSHVIVTAGKFNLHSLERTYRWLYEHNIPMNRSPLTRRHCGEAHFRRNAFTRQDMEDHLHPVFRAYPNGYVSYTPFFLSPELHAEVSGGPGQYNVTVPHNPSIGCWVGSWLAVSAEGDVSPCGILLDELTAGNIRDKRLPDLIAQSEIFETILDRTRLKGKCGRCRYKITCGGCRALAYLETGDFMEEDPTCFFEPVDETTVSEHEAITNRNFQKYLLQAALSGAYVRPARKAHDHTGTTS